MSYTYAVLGGGRQGTAAAFDMARFGEADRVLIADIDLQAAEASAGRLVKTSAPPMRALSAMSWVLRANMLSSCRRPSN